MSRHFYVWLQCSMLQKLTVNRKCSSDRKAWQDLHQSWSTSGQDTEDAKLWTHLLISWTVLPWQHFFFFFKNDLKPLPNSYLKCFPPAFNSKLCSECFWRKHTDISIVFPTCKRESIPMFFRKDLCVMGPKQVTSVPVIFLR